MSSNTPFTTQTAGELPIEDRIRHAVEDLITANPELYEDNVFARLNNFEIDNAGIIGKIDANYDENTDIYLAGMVRLPIDDPRFTQERLMTKTPYSSKDAIKETWRQKCGPQYDGARWHLNAEDADTFVSHMLGKGFSILAPIQLLAEIVDAEPATQTASTTQPQQTASTDRDYDYDGPTIPEDGETIQCPVDGCGFECESFESLRGHIGGMIAGGHHDHKGLDINISEYR